MATQAPAKAATSRAIIGALPGYNLNIDPEGQYAKKLLSSINRVNLKPIGYSININGLSADFTNLVKSIGSDNAVNIDINAPKVNSIYTIGQQANNSLSMSNITEKAKGTIDVQGALTIWSNILSANAKVTMGNNMTGLGIDPSVKELSLLCANDSTFTEVLSNNYKPSFIDSQSTGVTQQLMGKLRSLNSAQQLFQAFDSDAGRAVMRTTQSESDLLNMLTGKALGYQTTLPKEWYNSTYSSGLQLLIRLVSPSGHYTDISKYILTPLMYLICASSPVTYNGTSYGFPPLWRIEAEGMQTIPLGGISTISIARGGNDTLFNQWNQPLNVDVRLSIESIIDGFAVGIGPDGSKDNFYGDQSSAALGTGARKSLITNPQDIVDSFTYLTNNLDNVKEISVKL